MTICHPIYCPSRPGDSLSNSKLKRENGAGKIKRANSFRSVSYNNSFSTKHFLERLYVERLERKTELFYKLLECSNNNWEAVLFQSLVKGFGLNLNGDSFLATAESIPFSLVRKVQGKSLVLEAILMGQSGLLDSENEAGYFQKLKAIYTTYTQNYSLAAIGIPKPHFFRLRPSNFPTIRISQIAN